MLLALIEGSQIRVRKVLGEIGVPAVVSHHGRSQGRPLTQESWHSRSHREAIG